MFLKQHALQTETSCSLESFFSFVLRPHINELLAIYRAYEQPQVNNLYCCRRLDWDGSHSFVHLFFKVCLWKSQRPWQWTAISVLCSLLYFFSDLFCCTVGLLAGNNPPDNETEAFLADKGPNFINYEPICSWQPLQRGLYRVDASVQHKHSKGWVEGWRRKQGHFWRCAGSKWGGRKVEVFWSLLLNHCFMS